MRLNPGPQFSQGAYLLVRETGFTAAITAFSSHSATALGPTNNDPLVTKLALDDLASGGIDDEVIRIDRARNDGLTQARVCIDHGLPPLAGEWISSKEDTGDRGIDHALHHDRKLHTTLIDTKTCTIAHGAVGPQ